MKKILFLLLVLSTVLIFADEKRTYEHGAFANGTVTYLFGDNVRVRTSPEIKNNISDTLAIGTEVSVIKKDKEQMIGQINQNWYEVSYTVKGKKKTGFIWGALLALTYIENNGYYYLVGLKEYRKNSLYGECRLVKDNKLISKVEIMPHSTDFVENAVYGYSASSSIFNDKSLSGVEKIIKLSFTYEACGYSYGEIFIGLNKNKMIFLLKTENVSEAGLFAYTENAIFPSDKGGIPDVIQKKILGEEYSEESDEYKVETDLIEKYKLVGDKIQKTK